MSAFDFGDAMVVVTGAAAGLGLGIAQAFHAAGGRVALGDLRKDAVERAAAELGGERTFADVLDVRDAKSVQGFFAAAERALGPVTIAVANAGIVLNCPVLDMSVEEWDRVMETNLRGVFLTCQAAARSMQAGERPGKLITISSRSPQAPPRAVGSAPRTTAPRRPASSCSPRCWPWRWPSSTST
jgi:NAD(P)-dependent dehydrogenase (short-subunit alcohol dehydrogenase family)